MLTDALNSEKTNVAYFANFIGSLQENFLDKMSMNVNDLFLSNHQLRSDPKLSGRLLGLCEKIMAAGSRVQNSAA